MKYTKETLKELLKVYKTYSAIADHLGVTKQNVWQACKRFGLQSISGKVRRHKIKVGEL